MFVPKGIPSRLTPSQKLKNVYIDVAIAIGVPVIVMALRECNVASFRQADADHPEDYVVQGHRYNIIENIGCTPDIWNTVPAYPLVFMWPVLLGCITFVYAGKRRTPCWHMQAY